MISRGAVCRGSRGSTSGGKRPAPCFAAKACRIWSIDFLRFDVARDNEENIVGHVLIAVIAQDVLRLERVENIRVADDGEAIGAFGVGAFEQAPPGAPRRIVLVHVHLAADNIQFLLQFVRRQGGVLHDVAQDVHGHGRAGVGDVDMINGAVKGREGVHVTARRLDFLVDAAAGPAGGAFKEHVFQDVGQSRSQPFAFRDAAGLAPGLRRNDRRAVVFAE